jgi:hypothetical protein
MATRSRKKLSVAIQREIRDRPLAKEEAIRHLIHAAIRLVAIQEDPFAIHLIIQAADASIVGVSKRLEKPLAMSLLDRVRPEFKYLLIPAREQTAHVAY